MAIEFFPKAAWLHQLEDYVVHDDININAVVLVIGALVALRVCFKLFAKRKR
jgi:hypothetical protein